MIFPGVLAVDEPIVDWDWTMDHRDELWDMTVEHVSLTAWAVGLGFAISMVMALVALRWRWLYAPLAAFCEVLYTIPSLALFGILIPLTGTGFVPAEIALVGYTLLILLRNIVVGFDGVSPAVREAADGMGYERWRRILRIDLPLATPTIIAGLRIATVTTVGLVTVTALVGAGGYGVYIDEGLRRQPQFSTQIVLGTVLSVALAIVLDLCFVALERWVTPWRTAERKARRARVADADAAPIPGDVAPDAVAAADVNLEGIGHG